MNQNNSSSLVFYKSKDGAIQLDVKLENETVWLTQSQMSQLFGVDRTVVVRGVMTRRSYLFTVNALTQLLTTNNYSLATARPR